MKYTILSMLCIAACVSQWIWAFEDFADGRPTLWGYIALFASGAYGHWAVTAYRKIWVTS